LLAADLPLLGEADGEVLQALVLERGEDRHRDLLRAVLVAGQLLLELLLLRRRERVGVIADPAERLVGHRQREHGRHEELDQNFTSGALSALAAVALNGSFGLKPQIFAAITVGNSRVFTL